MLPRLLCWVFVEVPVSRVFISVGRSRLTGLPRVWFRETWVTRVCLRLRICSACCLASPAAEGHLHGVLSLKYFAPPRYWEGKLQTCIHLACGPNSRDNFCLFCSGPNSQTVVSCRREGGEVVEGNFLVKLSRWAGCGLCLLFPRPLRLHEIKPAITWFGKWLQGKSKPPCSAGFSELPIHLFFGHRILYSLTSPAMHLIRFVRISYPQCLIVLGAWRTSQLRRLLYCFVLLFCTHPCSKL